MINNRKGPLYHKQNKSIVILAYLKNKAQYVADNPSKIA